MKLKKNFLFTLSFFSLAAAVIGVAATSPSARKIFAANNGEWVHYKTALPGTIEGTTYGVREYWVQCGGSYQFTAPEDVTPVEATKYDLTQFNENDDRYIVSLDEQDVNLSSTSPSISLGSYTMTVTDIIDTATGTSFGSDISSLDVSSLASDHSQDGNKNLLVKSENRWIYAPTTFVTKYLATADDWKSITPTTSGQTVYGYYKMSADIAPAGTSAWVSGWDKAYFSGTIDGDGHKVTFGETPYGLFYVAYNATFKNFSMYNNWYRRTQTSYVHFAQKSINSTYSNLTFLKPVVASGQDGDYTPVANYGYMFGNAGAQGNKFDNCHWDFSDILVPCLFSHSSNTTNTNTFKDCSVTCGGLTEISYSNKGAITSADGLDIICNVSETVDVD